MGVEHGAFCIGCCWMLMGLLFVTGVMNLGWVAVLSAVVLLEKMSPAGGVLARVPAAVRASLTNRSRDAAVRASCNGSTLMATSRSSWTSRAR